MNLKNKKFFAVFLILTFVLSLINIQKVSATTTKEYSQSPEQSGFQIVPDCNNYVSAPGTPGQSQICGWKDLLQLVKNVMAFMFYISAFLFTMSVVYAGFLYLTAFGEMGKVEQAHGIFTKAIIGMIFVFLAWLIVATILRAMGVNEAFSLLNLTGVSKLNLAE